MFEIIQLCFHAEQLEHTVFKTVFGFAEESQLNPEEKRGLCGRNRQ
jgi:hypothetical protein